MGMPLDPQLQSLLPQIGDAGEQTFHAQSVEEARASYNSQKALTGQPEPVTHVEDRTIPGPNGEIPLRIYRPTDEEALPVLLYFHGGGWVLGNLDTADSICRSLANQAGCMVVSVDYRLAPEFKFPVPLEDAYAATEWVAAHGSSIGADSKRIAVGGDSAGANLAAVVALMARDRASVLICFQLLVYPVTNYCFDTASYHDNARGYVLTREDMIWFWRHYLRIEADGQHPYASPLLAENLSGLPPAYLITAEYDPLRDEGETFANRLREAGNDVVHQRYAGMVHGFFRMAGALDQGKAAVAEAARRLRSVFANHSQAQTGVQSRD